MDEYLVSIEGKKLDVARVVELLSEFSVRSVRRRGEMHYERDGQIKKNVRKVPNETSSVDLVPKATELMDFLPNIKVKLEALRLLYAEEIQIWALLHREEQLNGELSCEEISMLGAIGASYCWSVLLSGDRA